MDGMDSLKIEKYLEKGDPYTFALMVVDSTELMEERKYQETDRMLKDFGEFAKEKFSSGTILLPFEEDMFLAFAPFVLDKNHLMEKFDALQQEYYFLMQNQCPQQEPCVFIGCVIGTRRITLEELCQKAEKLVRALRKQGRYGYKIMEEE